LRRAGARRTGRATGDRPRRPRAAAAAGGAPRAALGRLPRGPVPRGGRSAGARALRPHHGALPRSPPRPALEPGARAAARPRAPELLGFPADGVTALQLADVATYLPGALLPKADLASMAHSLELRSPLLDHEVLELGVSLPDHLKLRGREGKQALRQAFAAHL